MPKKPSRPIALLEGLIVNIVWASSFIFVKMSLKELGPLTIGGLRYFIGFLFLLPFLRRRNVSLSRRQWLQMALIGVSAYTIANGATFWALKYLPATTVSFLMGFVTIAVLLGGMFWLREIPTALQMLGILITLGGMVLFFSPGLKPGEPLGLAILTISLLGFTYFNLRGRAAARDREVGTLALTALPLGIGGGLLLAVALPLEGLPSASLPIWGLVLWLAAINTALGYVLYNHALQTLTAFEMNVLLNLSPIWTALMGWALLGEVLLLPQKIGMAVVILGVMLVQKKTIK